jgi:hypothetical protein
VCSVADADKLTDWLAGHVVHAERNPARVREELLRCCREERIEPPAQALPRRPRPPISAVWDDCPDLEYNLGSAWSVNVGKTKDEGRRAARRCAETLVTGLKATLRFGWRCARQDEGGRVIPPA